MDVKMKLACDDFNSNIEDGLISLQLQTQTRERFLMIIFPQLVHVKSWKKPRKGLLASLWNKPSKMKSRTQISSPRSRRRDLVK